jgi:hypothetical protein
MQRRAKDSSTQTHTHQLIINASRQTKNKENYNLNISFSFHLTQLSVGYKSNIKNELEASISLASLLHRPSQQKDCQEQAIRLFEHLAPHNGADGAQSKCLVLKLLVSLHYISTCDILFLLHA